MASTIVTAYEQLLLDNVQTVQTVESAIRNVTWFLPGRFADGDIASEGLYALLSVVSSVHDALLEKRIPPALSLPPHPFAAPADTDAKSPGAGSATPRTIPLLPAASEHARYTRYWTDRSPAYKRASRALVTITYVELLLEMLAKKRGSDRIRWKVVLGLEGFKTFLRLMLLTITRRPIVWPPTPQREYDVSLIPQKELLAHNGKPVPKAADHKGKAPVARPVVPAVARAPLRTHLYPLALALPQEYLAHPLSLVPEFESAGEVTAELLSATAVLVQVILLMRQSTSPAASRFRRSSLPTLSRSLTPFFVPLLLQLVARRLRAPARDSTLLAEHYAQVDRRLASRFFLQGPMWIGWTRPKIVSFIQALERIPLIGLAGELVAGYLPLVDDYFYTVT